MDKDNLGNHIYKYQNMLTQIENANIFSIYISNDTYETYKIIIRSQENAIHIDKDGLQELINELEAYKRNIK